MAALTSIALVGLAVASTGLGVYGASRARKDAKKAQAGSLAFDARTAKLESKAILEEAALEAIEIRREGELFGKKQKALTAKAGLKLGRGTAKDIQEETKRLTEKDVATTLEAAERKSEQLLTTFSQTPTGAIAEVQKRAGGRRDEREDALRGAETALESGGIISRNFIKSKTPKKPLFGDL